MIFVFFFFWQDPSRVKKILPFIDQLDLTADTGEGDDDVDEMIQRLDMAMQVLLFSAVPDSEYFEVHFFCLFFMDWRIDFAL